MDLQAEVDALREQVEAAAVQRFMGVRQRRHAAADRLRRAARAAADRRAHAVATGASQDAFDLLRPGRGRLDAKSAELAAARDDVESQQQRFDGCVTPPLPRSRRSRRSRRNGWRMNKSVWRWRPNEREEQRRLAEEQRIAEEARQAEQDQLAAQQRAAAEEQQATR